AIGTVLAGCTSAADGLVAGEGAVAERSRGPLQIHEPTGDAFTRFDSARVAGTADGLVVGKGEVAGGPGSTTEESRIGNPATEADADLEPSAAAGVAAASQSLIVVECTVRDRGHPRGKHQGTAATSADLAVVAAGAGGVGTPNGLIACKRTSANGEGRT